MKSNNHMCAFSVLFLLAVSFFATASAGAANPQVNCDVVSLSDRLSQLSKNEPNTVTVSGTCNENILIQGFEDLTLRAGPQGATVADASGGMLATLQIERSQRVTLSGFSLTGGLNGIACVRSSNCILNSNTVQGAVLSGIFVFEFSSATLSGNTVRNNGLGLTALANSFLHLLGDNSTPANLVEQNQAQGLSVFDSSNARVEGTASAPNTFRDNGSTGVRVQNATLFLFSTVITGNGNPADPIFNGGGIQAENSGLRIFLAQISGNTGPGVLLGTQSHARVTQSTITGNSRNGLVLVLNSSANVFSLPANTVSGNTGADVFCDATAVLQNPGSIAGATTVSCPNQVVGFGPIP